MSALLRMIAGRIALGVLTLFMVSVVIFVAVEMLPGDVAEEMLGRTATPEAIAALREELGLNESAVSRYFLWLSNFIHGDLGTSMSNRREVAGLLVGRFANTAMLAAYAAAIAVPLSITLGLLAALYRGSFFDRAVNILSLSAISFPEFFVGYILIFFLSSKLRLFPGIAKLSPDIGFSEFLYVAFLPALTLTLVIIAHMMRMTRAAIINLLASPYIEMADLKGMPKARIIVKHALPNALAPIINVVALNLAYLITGVVLIEVVFVYPGLGQLLVDSVAKRDITVVQAACLIFAAVYVLLNLIADVLSIATNPRLMHRK
jgi:peptide/nickel transport system permease protein